MKGKEGEKRIKSEIMANVNTKLDEFVVTMKEGFAEASDQVDAGVRHVEKLSCEIDKAFDVKANAMTDDLDKAFEKKTQELGRGGYVTSKEMDNAVNHATGQRIKMATEFKASLMEQKQGLQNSLNLAIKADTKAVETMNKILEDMRLVQTNYEEGSHKTLKNLQELGQKHVEICLAEGKRCLRAEERMMKYYDSASEAFITHLAEAKNSADEFFIRAKTGIDKRADMQMKVAHGKLGRLCNINGVITALNMAMVLYFLFFIFKEGP